MSLVEPDIPPPDPALEAALAELGAAPNEEPVFDPSASALALREVLARRGATPAAALLRLAREIEGVRLDAAGALRVAVWGGAAPGRAIAAARERFGAAPRLAVLEKAEQAVAAARPPPSGPPQVAAVLALDGPWWGRLLVEPGVRVFAALPETGRGPPAALAVAAVATGPTGDDRTLWATDAAASAAAIEVLLGELGFAADLWAQAGGLKLFALAGYVQSGDERLARAPGRLHGVIGAAPVGFAP